MYCVHSSSAYVIPVVPSLMTDIGGPTAVMLLHPAFAVGIFSGLVGGGKGAFTKYGGWGLMRNMWGELVTNKYHTSKGGEWCKNITLTHKREIMQKSLGKTILFLSKSIGWIAKILVLLKRG